MKDSISYYDILNISARATDEEIKCAYLILAKKYHPDRNPQNRNLAARRFQSVSEAYSALKTREKRAKYNQKMRIAAENDNTKQTGIFSRLGDLIWPQNNNQYTKDQNEI